MTSLTVSFDGDGAFVLRARKGSTATLRGLLDSLPIASTVERWGDEIYFSVPFHTDLEQDARAEMELGTVAYWPDGDALAIFFGRTPSSVDDGPRAYSPCNIVGRLEGDLSALRSIKKGTKVLVSAR